MIEKILGWLDGLIPLLIPALLTLAIGSLFTKIVIKALTKGLKKSRIEPTTHGFIISLVKTSLYVFVFIIFLSTLNVPMSSIVATIGAAGLAIGLALQDSLSNIAGGFIILFSKPFKKGDYIQIDDESGKVDEISIFYTKLLTSDNKVIHIPNGNITAKTITNYNEENLRRLVLNFSIDYSNDYKKAIKIIKSTINSHPLALDKPDEPLVRMSEHASSAIIIVAKVWVKSENYWDLNYDLLEQIKDAFDENGISIPYDKLDVNLIQND